MTSVAFRLMFGIDEIGHLADGYLAKYKAADDEAVEAGRKIRERDYSRSNLEAIVGWKSTRRLGLIAENSDSEIADALHLAVRAKEPRSAFSVLIGCAGWRPRWPLRFSPQ